MDGFATPRRRTVTLGLLVLLLVASDLAWFGSGGAPLHWDSAIHLQTSLEANRIGDSPGDGLLTRALDFTWYYPPFVYWTAVPFHRLLGESMLAVAVLMALYHALLVLATYALGTALFGPAGALLAALIVGACPMMLEFARQPMLELPLAALVAVALVVLLRTKRFQDRPASLLLGLVLGCGLLTKWTFACFLAPPLAWEIWAARGSPARWNAALAIGVAALLASPWYAMHLLPIFSSRSEFLVGEPLPRWEALLFYALALPAQLSWLALPVLVLGLIVAARSGREGLRALAWTAGAYALLTLISFKQPRASLPMLPLLVVTASSGLARWVEAGGTVPAVRRLALTAFTGLFLAQAAVVTLVPPGSPAGRALATRLGPAPLLAVGGPRRDDWRQTEILEAVRRDLAEGGRERGGLAVVPDHGYFNRPTFQSAAALRRLPVEVTGIAGIPFLVDYVVLKTGLLGEDTERRGRVTASIAADTIGPGALYRTVGRFPLPDGSEAVLLATARDAGAATDRAGLRERLERVLEPLARLYLRPQAGFALTVREWDAASTCQGRFAALHLRADAAAAGDFGRNPEGVIVRGVDVELRDLRLNPAALAGRGIVQVVAVEELRVNGLRLAAADLARYLERSAKGRTRVASLTFRDGSLHAAVDQREPPLRLAASARLWTRDDEVHFACQSLHLGWLPVAPGLVNLMTRSYDPLLKHPEGVTRVRLGRLELNADTLRLGANR